MKDKMYKCLVSIPVVIYAQDMKRVLTLQWRGDPDFRRSVTGSVEEGETAPQAAMREIRKEVTVDVITEQLTLIDCQHMVEFGTFSHLRHRYASGVARNTESQFCLALPHERQIVFTEHLAYKWLDTPVAATLTRSWSNRQVIEQLVINTA